MRRSARQAEMLTEFVALLAREVQHRRHAGARRSQIVLAAQILDELETMPDLGPALGQLRMMDFDRMARMKAKPRRKPTGRVIVLDQPA